MIDEGNEKDSYMYQSVGTNVSPLIAEALGVPIFRREI
jgi:diphthamide synthase (EF-2-diphthine--ammonia ligase)